MTMTTRSGHIEIDVLYKYTARSNKEARNSNRLITALRKKELERVFASRYGDELPDDDAGMSDLVLMANHIAFLGGDAERNILRWAGEWAPWLCWTNLDPELFAQRIAANPRRYRSDTLAALLNLTMSSRTALGITTIGAVDCNKEQRLQLRRERKRAYSEAVRRAAGAKPRAQYEAESLARTRPWEKLGMSQRTWYRRGKPMPVEVAEVQTQQVVLAYMPSTNLCQQDEANLFRHNQPSKFKAIVADIPLAIPPAWAIPTKPEFARLT